MQAGQMPWERRQTTGSGELQTALEASTMSNKITFSVIVRDANSWDQSTGICAELANCGHAHRTIEAAQHCMEQLTAWHCFCGRTTQSYAPCCHTPHNSTSARWYHAHIEASNGEAVSRG
jgi:hypothetical protein